MEKQITIFKKISPSTLQRRVDEYFESVKKKKITPTLTGLALHLRCTRKNITDYMKTDLFGEILDQAKLKCEHVLEERISNGAPPTGMMFVLKNNYGWKDKVEINQNINGSLSLSSLFDKSKALLDKRKEEAIEGEVSKPQKEDSLPTKLF